MAPIYSGSGYFQTPTDSYASSSGYAAELGTETPDTIANTCTTCLLSQDGIPCMRCFFKMATSDASCEPQPQVPPRLGRVPTACKDCRRKHKKCVNFPREYHVDIRRFISFVPMEKGEFCRIQSKIGQPDQNEMVQSGAQDGEIHEQQHHEQQGEQRLD